MKPIITDRTNVMASGDGCEDLPLTKTKDGEFYESCWELSEEELKLVQTTRKIYVGIRSKDVYPMCVSTETMLLIENEETENMQRKE